VSLRNRKLRYFGPGDLSRTVLAGKRRQLERALFGETFYGAAVRRAAEDLAFGRKVERLEQELREAPLHEQSDLRRALDLFIVRDYARWHRWTFRTERWKLRKAVRAKDPAALVAMQRIRVRELEWWLEARISNITIQGVERAKRKLADMESRLAAPVAPVLEIGGTQ